MPPLQDMQEYELKIIFFQKLQTCFKIIETVHKYPVE